jgi:tetratricopeptide (TPR) repeat protein
MPTPTVFLSYAREDDEPFVRRLHADLTADGFDVWFDRVDLPSRQLTFHQEIKDAIRARDRLVLVAGPRAATSDYVLQECRFALAIDKPVVPILRAGDFDAVPAFAAGLHCEDFRDDAAYREQFARLAANLRRPLPPLGRLFAVPELPAHFVARPGLVQRIEDMLLADTRSPAVLSGAAARLGLSGMGGIGKSALAAAIARDPEVRRAYPDGVVWLRCGQQPDVAALQRQIAAALGAAAPFDDEAQGRGVVREMLRERALLLVFDDVWQTADVTRVAEPGPRCRALVTTRDAGVLDSLQCLRVAVDSLDEAESLRLLGEAVQTPVSALPSAAHQIAAACGGLPLALSLCAGLARGAHGLPWSDIVQALRDVRFEQIADEQAVDGRHRNLAAAIRASVDRLDALERRRWAELAVFSRDRTFPVSAVCLLWQHTGGLDGFGSKSLLRKLAQRSLLEPGASGAGDGRDGAEQVALHDVVAAFALRLAGDRRALHRNFADAAWAEYVARPEQFHGYAKRHLPRHLVDAGEPRRLLALLADPRLGYFQQWAEQGSAAEGMECLEALVQDPVVAGDAGLVRQLATQLARLGNRCGNEGAAQRWLEVALRGYRGQAPARRADAVALHELASLAFARGRYVEARSGYRQALRVARRLDPPADGEIAANLIGLAAVNNLTRKRASRTIRLATLALRHAEAEQDAPHAAEACRLLADEYGADMRYEDAERFLERGLSIAQHAKLAEAYLSLATARAWMLAQRAELGERSPQEAESAFRELCDEARTRQDWRAEADAWSGLGLVALLCDETPLLDAAIDRLAALLAGRSRFSAEARLRLFEATRSYRAGRFADASEQFGREAAACREAGHWARLADALVGRAAALQRCGDADAAAQCAREVELALKQCPRVRQVIARANLAAGRCAGQGARGA